MVIEKSPFPDDYVGVELYYGGEWHDLADDLDQQGVRVTHGARSEGGRADVSSLSFRLTNEDGKYSPRNPTSPLYGLAGRNTPARARVELGAPWLDLEADGARATMPDLELDITNDLDVRWWGYRHDWNAYGDVISKWQNEGNQRSWLLQTDDPADGVGGLSLYWSTDGSNFLAATSTVGLPAWVGEAAVRATLDVDNGAGGHTVRFYYAANLEGPWVQLGDDVVGSGTTTIYDGTALVTLGRTPTTGAVDTPQRVYGWELRAAIDGATRSSCSTADLEPGATSFTDNQGNTWTITDGTVSNTHVVAVGEVAEWPVDWNTKGAPSVMTEVEAAGVRRRLGQGEQPVESVLYRATAATAESADLIAYWPMEDGTDARRLGVAIGSQTGAIGANVRPGTYEFPASSPLPTTSNSRIRAEVDAVGNTGEVQVRWVQRTAATLPVADTAVARIEFRDGSIGHVDIRVRQSDGIVGLFGYDFDGNELGGSTYVAGTDVRGSMRKFSVELNQNGSAVFWRRSTLQVGDLLAETYGQNFTGSHTLGRVARVILNPQYRSLDEHAVGHLTVGRTITPLFDGVEGAVLLGHRGESAADRIERLATENGVPVTIRSRGSAALGEQQEQTLLALFAESEAADGGIVHDDPTRLGVRYRNLRSLFDQPAVTIAYDDNLINPFRPTDDDGLTRNRVSAQRPEGTKITHELAEGPLSVQPPPAGVGVYDTSATLNLDTDDLIDRAVWWDLHTGTWDEARYPTLGVDLADPRLLDDPVMVRRLLALAVGDRLVITDPPSWLPPFPVDVLVMGARLEATPLHLRLQWTCVPARPYRVGYWNAGHRLSGSGTVTAAALSEDATSFNVTPPVGVTWTHADGDYDVVVGGEVMTVTDVVGDTFTVARSVNGVVKAHPAGTAVALAAPSFYGR